MIDSDTGMPVPNAVLEYGWRLYDYPMLDGAGSYEITGSTTTDENGQFILAVPSHRRGLWNTEMFPPMVRADGYKPFMLSDWPASVRYENGKVIMMMTPLSTEDGD